MIALDLSSMREKVVIMRVATKLKKRVEKLEKSANNWKKSIRSLKNCRQFEKKVQKT